jgi:hypothetical protein
MMSQLSSALLLQKGHLISVDEKGSVFAGGSIRVPATEIEQMGWIHQPEIAGMSEMEGENVERLYSENSIGKVGHNAPQEIG